MKLIQGSLIVLLFAAGTKVLFNIRKYHKNGQKKWVIASLLIGLLAYVCAVLAWISIYK